MVPEQTKPPCFHREVLCKENVRREKKRRIKLIMGNAGEEVHEPALPGSSQDRSSPFVAITFLYQ